VIVTKGFPSALITRGYGAFTGEAPPVNSYRYLIFDTAESSDLALSVMSVRAKGQTTIQMQDAVEHRVEMLARIFDQASIEDATTSVKTHAAVVKDSARIVDGTTSVKEGWSRAATVITGQDRARVVVGLISVVFDEASSSDGARGRMELVCRIYDEAHSEDATTSVKTNAAIVRDAAFMDDQGLAVVELSNEVYDEARLVDRAASVVDQRATVLDSFLSWDLARARVEMLNAVHDEVMSEDQAASVASLVSSVFDRAQMEDLVRVLYQKLVEVFPDPAPEQPVGEVVDTPPVGIPLALQGRSIQTQPPPSGVRAEVTIATSIPARVRASVDPEKLLRKVLRAVAGAVFLARPQKSVPSGQASSQDTIPPVLVGSSQVPSPVGIPPAPSGASSVGRPGTPFGMVQATTTVPGRVKGEAEEEE
jgi:hypothetical protein